MLDWLTTIPGILIICGVILLVIAIILFILGAKKSKKVESPVLNQGIENNTILETPVSTQTIENNMSSAVNEAPSVNVTPITETVVTPNMDQSINVEVKEEIPVSETINIEEAPSVSTVEIPTYTNPVENIEPAVNIPDVNSQVEEITIPAIEEPSTIYGGEVPTVDFTNQEEKPVTIYGGNDPLEATQTLPKMDEHHEPYGGSYPEVRIVEPVVEEPVVTPIEEIVEEIPTIEPVVINEPEVVSIPVEEPVITEIPVAPVEVSEPVIEEL